MFDRNKNDSPNNMPSSQNESAEDRSSFLRRHASTIGKVAIAAGFGLLSYNAVTSIQEMTDDSPATENENYRNAGTLIPGLVAVNVGTRLLAKNPKAPTPEATARMVVTGGPNPDPEDLTIFMPPAPEFGPDHPEIPLEPSHFAPPQGRPLA